VALSAKNSSTGQDRSLRCDKWQCVARQRGVRSDVYEAGSTVQILNDPRFKPLIESSTAPASYCPEHWQKNFNFLKNVRLRTLEKSSMKKNPTPEDPDYSLSFWVVALWPLICVAIGFLAATVIETL
jgi:hypothetical protein